MNFKEINNFVVAQRSDEYFDKDKDLFKKLYPASKLIPALENANEYNKEELDGRMLMEIRKVVCGETVLENRGIKKIIKKKADSEKSKLAKAKRELKKLDPEKAKYNVLASLAARLKLTTADRQKPTLVKALMDIKAELYPAAPETGKEKSKEGKKKEAPE